MNPLSKRVRSLKNQKRTKTSHRECAQKLTMFIPLVSSEERREGLSSHQMVRDVFGRKTRKVMEVARVPKRVKKNHPK